MKKFNCIVVDDEEIDRLMTISMIKKHDELNLLKVFDNAESALKFLNENEVDILFLDIDMPDTNGFELRKRAMQIPACIFITAHPEHALDSFELDTLDFIVKPIKQDRFERTVQRINEFMAIKKKAIQLESTIEDDSIYIKEGHEQTKVKLKDVIYLEALKDYTLVVTPEKRHCVLSSIGVLLKGINFNSFVRIHRSYAVQKQFVRKIHSQEIELNNNVSIPVGRSYKENLSLIA